MPIELKPNTPYKAVIGNFPALPGSIDEEFRKINELMRQIRACQSDAEKNPLIAELEARIVHERQLRITAQFDALAMEYPGIDREDWLPRVLADESLLAVLEQALSGSRSLAQPIAGSWPT